MHDEEESVLIEKGPCPDCGSSDACALYSDGHTYCYSCEKVSGDGEPRETKSKRSADLLHGEYTTLAKRKINEETCRKFGYLKGTRKYKGKPVQIAEYRDQSGAVVAQHLRDPDKEFPWIGKVKDLQLFGQHLWRDKGKMLVITEGEIDAMSVSQMQGNKWPVVSVYSGAKGAKRDIKRNLEWVEGFESVIFMFDMDEQGRSAAEECALLLTPGKAKIAQLDLKDANEMLVAGRGKEIINAIWNAKEYRPDGIVTISDIKSDVLTPTEVGFSWPWPTLTKETFGIHRKFLYALGAGTGVGKTDVFTQCVAHTIMGSPERNEPGRPAATFFLEQPPAETVKRIAGKVFGKRFHVPDGGWTDEDLSAAVDALESEGLLYIYNHFGSIDWDVIKSRMRFVAIQYGVKDIFLDHLTALAAHASDEKKAIEEIMAELAGMAHELDLTIYFISHLATPDGKPHEEGGRVMIRHFKGSRAIGYWSYFMFGLERDQQAEDEKDRQTTTFRILKDRLTGQSTGKTFLLGYDPETGILYEKQPEDDCDFEDETVNEDDDVPF